MIVVWPDVTERAVLQHTVLSVRPGGSKGKKWSHYSRSVLNCQSISQSPWTAALHCPPMNNAGEMVHRLLLRGTATKSQMCHFVKITLRIIVS